MLKIRDGVDLKELEKYGFEYEDLFYKDTHYAYYNYEFLTVNLYSKEIFIASGVDEVNGSEEVTKLYDLIKADLVEKID